MSASGITRVDIKNPAFPIIVLVHHECFGNCCMEGPDYPRVWHSHGQAVLKLNTTSPDDVRLYLKENGWSSSFEDESKHYASSFTMNDVSYEL